MQLKRHLTHYWPKPAVDPNVIGRLAKIIASYGMKHFLALVALIATPANADGHRPSDSLLDMAGMDALLTGNVITFYDGSKSTYRPDGSYGYTYTDDGPIWRGEYTLSDDSQVCVEFEGGSTRCDMFVMDGERPVLITSDGTRFPVRNLTVYEP